MRSVLSHDQEGKNAHITHTQTHAPGLQLSAAHPETPAAPGGVSSALTPPLHDMSPSGCGAAPRDEHGSRPAGPPPAPHSSCSENKSPGECQVQARRDLTIVQISALMMQIL